MAPARRVQCRLKKKRRALAKRNPVVDAPSKMDVFQVFKDVLVCRAVVNEAERCRNFSTSAQIGSASALACERGRMVGA